MSSIRTAHTPLPKGTRAASMKEWRAQHHAPRRGLLHRLFPRASLAAHNRVRPEEAGADATWESRS